MTEPQKDPICNDCGEPRSEHGLDQCTMEPTKCPVAPGDMGQTPLNNEHLREKRNMQAADVDGIVCSHPYGEPHEAEYEQLLGGTWQPVCHDHVDPTNDVRKIQQQTGDN